MICVHHSADLDGWMSAAIVKMIFPDCELVGYNYGDPELDLSEHDEVILVDISFPVPAMEHLQMSMERFIWIDHHISAIKANIDQADTIEGRRNTKFAACELTWLYFFPDTKMPELVRLLGRYDCFGHKGTSEEEYVLAFQYGARSFMRNPEECLSYLQEEMKPENHTIHSWIHPMYSAGVSIYSYLCNDAKLAYADRKNVVLYEGEMAKRFCAINKERFNPINFGIDYNKDNYDGCFCYWIGKDGKVSCSVYNDDNNTDCSIIAKTFGGGGHKGASGFRIDISQLQQILSL